MKVFNQHVGSMYIWAIALLAFLDIVAGYTLRILPISLIIAVAVTSLLEIIIDRFYIKRPLKIPFSGIITGLIIGSIAPYNATLLVVLVASIIAIFSKFFIKIKSINVFNPAALGLLIAITMFSVGDVWWAAISYNVYGIAITFTPLLIIASYKAKRLVSSLSFLAVFFAISIILTYAGNGILSIMDIRTMFLGANYFFGFLMLPEPKTSPNKSSAQLAYGTFVAVLYAITAKSMIPHPFLVTLLICNTIYAVYRARGNRIL